MTRTVLAYIIGSLIVGALIFGARQILNPTRIYARTIATDVIQGILVGVALAFITLVIIGNAYVTKVNGWTTMFGCGEPGNGLLRRAACNVIFLGPVNVPQEAMYWKTSKDGVGHRLNGRHDYLITGPGWKGQVPSGMVQITSPDNSVLVLGRIIVYSDSDLPTAYGLAKQIQLTSLSGWHPKQWHINTNLRFVV